MSTWGKCVVEDNREEGLAVLRVRAGDLRVEELGEFYQASCELIASAMPRLEVDLSRVAYTFSVYVASLVDLAERAREIGKPFTAVVKPHVAGMFRRMEMEGLVTLRVIGEEPPPDS